MRPPLFIQSSQFVEAHSAKQTTSSNMHKLFFLPFRKLLWSFSKFLDTDEKKHNFNIGKFHLEVTCNNTLQLRPFFINLRCFHTLAKVGNYLRSSRISSRQRFSIIWYTGSN